MKILFAVDEAFPLYKIGGLGDVGGSLPPALRPLGLDVRIALPFHPEIQLKQAHKVVNQFSLEYTHQQLEVSVIETLLPQTDVPVYLFKEDRYLSEHTDASDNHADKFSLFSDAVCHWLVESQTFKPDLIHLHDWHTALIPVILKHKYHTTITSLLTIHNLAYQGNTSTPIVQHLGLPHDACQILQMDAADNTINILLEGILHADHVSTVSPTYATEILTHEYGEQIDEIISIKSGSITGILNGIDLSVWNPETDTAIRQTYSAARVDEAKIANQNALLQACNLERGTGPIIGYVGRVDGHQKGIELIIQALINHQLTPDDSRFIFLGTGDPHLEQQLSEAAQGQEETVHMALRYDEELAHQIYAAADLVVIPSKYEPCGLVQMMAMRYGSLPVARATGGLIDTIQHQHNGFLFTDYTTTAFVECLVDAVNTIQDQDVRATMRRDAMKQDFSWDASARLYQQLYQSLHATP